MKKVGRKQREKQTRKTAILQAAEALFARKGFHGATMAKIAEAAEFAVGSLYLFFRSKDELFATMTRERAKSFLQVINGIVEKKEKALKKLRSIIRTHFSFVEKNRDFFKIYLLDRAGFEWNLRAELGEEIFQSYSEYIRLVEEVVRQGVREGELRAVPPREAAICLVGILNTFVTQRFEGGEEWTSMAGEADIIMDIYLKGVLSS